MVLLIVTIIFISSFCNIPLPIQRHGQQQSYRSTNERKFLLQLERFFEDLHKIHKLFCGNTPVRP